MAGLGGSRVLGVEETRDGSGGRGFKRWEVLGIVWA